MKILLLAYEFAPVNSAQSLRWYNFVKFLVKNGFDVTVLAPNLSVVRGLETGPLVDVRIVRYFPGPFSYLTNKLANRSSQQVAKPHYDTNLSPPSRRLRTSAYKVVVRTLNFIFFPDYRLEATPFLYLKARRLVKHNQYQMTVSSHEPAITVLAGLWLKQRFPELRWVVDFGDPILARYTKKQHRWLATRLEKRAIQECDGVVVTNVAAQQLLTSRYPLLVEKPKCVVMQGGLPPERSTARDRVEFKKIRICFTGTFYKSFRDPNFLDECIPLVPELEWTFVGDNSDFAYLGRHENVRMISKVDPATAHEYQANSDVLLSMGNEQPDQLPGKIFEYLVTNRFILHLYNSPADLTLEILEADNFSVVCQNKPAEILAGLHQLVDRMAEGEPVARDVHQYSWDNRAEKLAGFLLEIASERSRDL